MVLRFLFLFISSSINKNINGLRDKKIANPALHEGLLLLIYEFFKAQNLGKEIEDRKPNSEEPGSDYVTSGTSLGKLSDDSEDIKNKKWNKGSPSKKQPVKAIKIEKP